MSRIKYALWGLLLLGIAGCGEKAKETAEEEQAAAMEESAQQPPEARGEAQEAPQVSAPEPAEQTPAARAPSKATRQAPVDVTEAIKPVPRQAQSEPAPRARQVEEQRPAPQVQEPRYITISAGTAIQVRLQDALDSSVNKSGDTFRTILDQDIDVNGNIVAPRGSILEGRLSDVAQSGRVEGRAKMSLRLISLQIGDQSYPLHTNVLAFEAEPTTKKDATKVGIGAGIGAVIGAIAGGGKGAAIGAAVGGGAGGATVLATRGKEVKFEPEQKFNFAISEDVSVRTE
jgi:hypothetical protein